MSDKPKKDIPEPPKFDLEDLPEPPQLDNSQSSLQLEVPREKEKEMSIPAPVNQKTETVNNDIPPPPTLDQPLEKKESNAITPTLDAGPNDIPPTLDLPVEKKKPISLTTKLDESPKDIPLPIQLKESNDTNLIKLEQLPPAVDLDKELMSMPTPDAKPKKTGLFGGLFGKKKNKEQKLDTNLPELPNLNDPKKDIGIPQAPDDKFFAPKIQSDLPPIPIALESSKNTEISIPPVPNMNDLPDIPKLDDMPIMPQVSDFVADENPAWLEEAEHFRNDEMELEGDHYIEEHKEVKTESEAMPITRTPLSEVKGVGPKRQRALKKAGIKTAESLAKHDHKKVAKKIKIPESHAKKIVSHAKKITKIKKKLSTPKKKKGQDITDIISSLETERKAIDRLKKQESMDEDKLLELEGHKEIVKVLEKLEKKRYELQNLQDNLIAKEKNLDGNKNSYRRDLEYIDNLKRRLDHDVRERTQYLINLEKEYFQKAQKLATQKSEVELKNKTQTQKELLLKDQEHVLKEKLHDIEDRDITIETKEKKLNKIMEDLDKQDITLREKEEDLIKRESEYLKKLDVLESHEKSILKNLENKRKSLESKEKEVKMREDRLHKTQRNIDKKEVAVEYAKGVMQEEKSKLIDDEFEQYLHDQLTGSGNINFKDVNTLQNLKIPDLGNSNTSVYKLHDTCKALIKQNKVAEAKVYYNQLRDRYYGLNYSNIQEKETVHNMIRSLYDEINLADMGRRH